MAGRAKRWQPTRRLEVDYQDEAGPQWVGSLTLSSAGMVFFQYAPTWLAQSLELSPMTLALESGRRPVSAPHPKTMHGLHGLFADSLPDQWGLRIQDRLFRRHGIPLHQVGALDRLALLGRRTMGALTYRPATAQMGEGAELTSLDDLLAEVDGLERELSRPRPEGGGTTALDALEAAAGTAGGAQPKAVLAVTAAGAVRIGAHEDLPSGYHPHLIKFTPERSELGLRRDAGVVEEAYARLARAAGIPVPPSRLLSTSDGRAHFTVERFDRTPTAGRRHVHTLAGLLGREASAGTDYSEYLRAAVELTRRQATGVDVLRRLCFNVLTLNDDDHARNVAFLLDPAGEWGLAPAYDLTFAPGRGDERGMAVAGHGRTMTRRIIMEFARQEGIGPRAADEVYEEVRTAVTGWSATAEAVGVSAESIEEIEQAMASRRHHLEGPAPPSVAR